MSLGVSASKSGLKPLKRTVRSSAGDVWLTGMVAPSGSFALSPISLLSEMYRWPTRFR